MGIIRNSVVIVYDGNKNALELLRKNAVQYFQEVVRENDFEYDFKYALENGIPVEEPQYDVDTQMVTPVMESLANKQYSFMTHLSVQIF